MRYQSQEQRHRRVFFARAFMVAAVIGIGFLGNGVFNIYHLEREAKERREVAEANLHNLEDREVLLERSIESLDTIAGVEAALRKQYDVAREGEGLIVVVGEEKEQEATETHPWWRAWWDSTVEGW